MIRFFDIILAVVGLFFSLPFIAITCILIIAIDHTNPFFIQKRVGLKKSTFFIIKLKTMKTSKHDRYKPSHEISNKQITSLGKYLRKIKLDELPQLINVFVGEMSFVGPRPCLLNQTELIRERDKLGVFDVLPGITGLSQTQGIDMKNAKSLALSDFKMIKEFNKFKYFKYIFLTVLGKGYGDKTIL